ncbi:MAG: hypothetical protein IPM04_16140 [Saprospiraceae bacterium]|nr:hypothetical protein [Candidatus Brachybacter algidus]MBK8749285.1 hypothetical protein [Candidatus Brachybacter algidus]
MQAMQSSNIHPLQGQVELGLFDVGYLNNTSGSKKNERKQDYPCNRKKIQRNKETMVVI